MTPGETPPDRAAGILPPHDLEAEAAVLSGIVLVGGDMVTEVEPFVDSRDFYSESHKWIFDAAVDLQSRGQPVDLLTVQSWLKDRNRMAMIGGAGYLADIAAAAPAVHVPHIIAHAQRVRYRARLRRLARSLETARAEIYAGVADENVETFLVRVEKDVLDAAAPAAAKRKHELEHIGVGISSVLGGIDENERRGGGALGIPTGFGRLDRMTGGMHDGDLTIVGGRPGMGKSAFVGNVAEIVAGTKDRDGVDLAVAIFSLEMPRNQFIARMLCSLGRANLVGIRTGQFTASEHSKIKAAGADLRERGIYIDDTSGLKMGEMRQKLQKLKAILARSNPKRRLALVVTDYLQLMNPEQQKGENRSSAIGRMTREQKGLAKELEVPFMTLAQLNREGESRDNKRPVITDLRDSGEIEQDADNILFLYRDGYYDKNSAEANVAEVIVAKQRSGPTGTAKLRFDKEWVRFDNLSEGEFFDEETPAPQTRSRSRQPPQSPSRQYIDRIPEPPAGRFEDSENHFLEGP